MHSYRTSLIHLGLILASFSLQATPRALGQNSSDGFYIPSLQTLLMMPMSQAGDRFEAKWLQRSSGKNTATCQRSTTPSAIQCDAWIEPPSYVLDDRNRTSAESDQSHTLELNALELNAPVRIAKLERIMAQDTNVRLASGTLDTKTVRVTSVSEGPSSASPPRRAGEIKEKHLQRKPTGYAGGR
jgi:hypothetical protein